MELMPNLSVLKAEKAMLLVVSWLEEEPIGIVDDTREPVDFKALVSCKVPKVERARLVEDWSELLPIGTIWVVNVRKLEMSGLKGNIWKLLLELEVDSGAELAEVSALLGRRVDGVEPSEV